MNIYSGDTATGERIAFLENDVKLYRYHTIMNPNEVTSKTYASIRNNA
ncbi:hypothetical protein [Anaplasma phagocytophilum]|uniref:p44 outermembrane protein, silent n=1 Tax=Anaplasma phagocytophilum TaxID=948 RepID=A0A098GKZ8_ANAPH|nr:hypothetical protein [Anaplasma phagocytophilum]CEH11201.1 P44 outermembrane protein, silent [Anaplasma phagocytophilum]